MNFGVGEAADLFHRIFIFFGISLTTCNLGSKQLYLFVGASVID